MFTNTGYGALNYSLKAHTNIRGHNSTVGFKLSYRYRPDTYLPARHIRVVAEFIVNFSNLVSLLLIVVKVGTELFVEDARFTNKFLQKKKM